MLRLDAGERLPETLVEWARQEGIGAASVVAGIGMVRDTEIGYLRSGGYETAQFPEPLELLALTGSVAHEDGGPSLHLHLIGGRPDHSTVGGHLIHTTVAVLAEVTVETFPGRRFRRPADPARGIRTLDLNESAG
jgi:predicted DNA-binding protein with PD1-like motif